LHRKNTDQQHHDLNPLLDATVEIVSDDDLKKWFQVKSEFIVQRQISNSLSSRNFNIVRQVY